MREKIGRYEILRKIGRGGMGDVFRAFDPNTESMVAIKILRPFEAMVELVGYDRLKELFISEAETMSYLDHPAVVNVLDSGRDDEGAPYFVMEFFCNNLGDMIGESFRMEKRSRSVGPVKVLEYGRQLLEGLSYIHKHRVVHRDIKPFNIMITDDDQLRICDFGMALVDDISFSGLEGVQIGSPFYAAPEQKRDPGNVDGRADLYAVGVLLYRMLTGELASIRDFSLSRVNHVFDRTWDDFFATALSLQPDTRFQSALEMQGALSRLRINKKKALMQTVDKGQIDVCETVALRKEPVNLCGKAALAAFGLNEQFCLAKLPPSDLVREGEGVIRDRVTDLLWHEKGSRSALTVREADRYITGLNQDCFGGKNIWRLPTVTELFSLLGSPILAVGNPAKARQNMFWSSDLHGKQDAWYVNLDMGYAAGQDVNCRNFVRAVCS